MFLLLSSGTPGGGDPQSKVFFGVMTGAAIVGLLALYNGQYNEITWRDFQNGYLNKGVVSLLYHAKHCLIQ